MARRNQNKKYIGIFLVVALILAAGTLTLGMWELPSFSVGGVDRDSSHSTGTGHPLTSNFTIKEYNAEDKDATFGDADVYGKIWKPGTADWTGEYVVLSTDFWTASGNLDFSGVSIYTGQDYDVLAYQGDAGTNLYPETLTVSIPNLDSQISQYTWPDTVFMYTEGSFSESACDSATAGFDEANTTADVIQLDKSLEAIEGTLSWDCTFAQGTAGAVLKDAVIIFREDPATVLTDINDIEHIYLSVKSGGTGLALPSGDLLSEFLAGVPLNVGVPIMRSSNDATITVQISLPASESSVGTGNFQMIFDDLGDYRAKADVFGSSDYDVHAAAEITTWAITT